MLVHGFASSFERNWRETGWADLLEDAGRSVVGVDLLGHGTAEKPHDPAAYADLEGYVATRIPPGPVDGVGFSLGARILLAVAAREPDRFSRLVVAGVGANLFTGGDPDPIARAIEDGPGDESHPIARIFAQFAAGSDNDPAALAACLRRPAAPLDPADLGRIDCPVLVVLGDRDFAGPADPLIDALPNARLVTLAGVDHFATPRDFRFLDAALEFLDALPA